MLSDTCRLIGMYTLALLIAAYAFKLLEQRGAQTKGLRKIFLLGSAAVCLIASAIATAIATAIFSLFIEEYAICTANELFCVCCLAVAAIYLYSWLAKPAGEQEFAKE